MELLRRIAAYPLFKLGGTVLTPGQLATSLALLVFLVIVTRLVARAVTKRFLAAGRFDPGLVHATATIGRYVLLSVGLLVLLGTVGVDLSALVVVFGTLGVGIGLALQPLLTNFISGLVLLFERSIKVGDRIEIGQLTGQVTRIAARSTTIVTNDKISVIVPNGQLAASQIINWSHADRSIRFRVPVGVAYASDATRVAEVLVAVARGHEGVLAEPSPDVIFDGFGDSALNFELRIWTSTYATRPGALRSELNFAILDAFRAHGIEIPFPQRDIHIRTLQQAQSASPPVE